MNSTSQGLLTVRAVEDAADGALCRRLSMQASGPVARGFNDQIKLIAIA